MQNFVFSYWQPIFSTVSRDWSDPRRKTKYLEIMSNEKWVVETGGISPRKGLFSASLKMFEQL